MTKNKKRRIVMATTSFDKKITIKDNKSAKSIIRELSKQQIIKPIHKIDVVEQLKRSSELLKNKYSR